MAEIACANCGAESATKVRLQVFPWRYVCRDLCAACAEDVRGMTQQVRDQILGP